MESENYAEDTEESKRLIVALCYDVAYAALLLVALTGIEFLVKHLPLNAFAKSYITTTHEWGSIAVFTIFVLKSLIIVAIKSWRQVWKIIKAGS